MIDVLKWGMENVQVVGNVILSVFGFSSGLDIGEVVWELVEMSGLSGLFVDC